MINIKKISPSISIGILDMAAFAKNRPGLLKRELEKAGSRFLIGEMLNITDVKLDYFPTNKPFLSGRTEHISISHSHDKLAVIINKNENTGIDIELVRDKVLKIQHKFLNVNEMAFAKDQVEKLITIWAAKETMYKAYGLKELDFIHNLSVEEFEGNIIKGEIKNGIFTKKYKLASEKIDNYKLVYVLNEI